MEIPSKFEEADASHIFFRRVFVYHVGRFLKAANSNTNHGESLII